MNNNQNTLEERVEKLETALLQNNKTLQSTFRLSPIMANTLGLLMSLPVVPSKTIEDEVEVAAQARITIHRLRRYLEPHDIKILSRRGQGYWLDQDTKDRIAKLIS